jgi:adenine-specific DNA-methyltransferase
VRYIGNKTKLLPFIGEFLDRRHIPTGRVFDAFAGTAAVGSYLKARGASVVGCDLMTFSYVFQRAYVVVDRFPRLARLADDPGLRAARGRSDFAHRVHTRIAARADEASAAVGPPGRAIRPLVEALVYLDSYLDPLTSFISRHFATAAHGGMSDARGDVHGDGPSNGSGDGRGGASAARGAADRAPDASTRMYFTLDGARRIDAIRHQLHEWRARGVLTDDEFYVLLAALLEGADAVANTAGVYAAYIKQWQSNALRAVELRLPPLTPRSVAARGRTRSCEAYLGDVSTLARQLGHFDLLYLDPPYNTRQYSGYYHVPELIARGWFDGEPAIRGKTGLLADAPKSAWSTRAGCVAALDGLLRDTDADHVVMSYNAEGIIPEPEIARIFREHGLRRTYARVARQYQRYRSDRSGPARQYKADTVREHLYYVRRR